MSIVLLGRGSAGEQPDRSQQVGSDRGKFVVVPSPLPACTADDACKNSVCIAGSVLVCNDNNPCTADYCDSKAGCTHTANSAACNDGDPCTNDKCSAGKCVGTAFACDPCMDAGKTYKTFVTGHIIVCGAQFASFGWKNTALYGGWHWCTEDDIVKFADTTTPKDVGISDSLWVPGAVCDDPKYAVCHYSGYAPLQQGELHCGWNWCSNYINLRAIACHN